MRLSGSLAIAPTNHRAAIAARRRGSDLDRHLTIVTDIDLSKRLKGRER
jgi:hypothetical protein